MALLAVVLLTAIEAASLDISATEIPRYEAWWFTLRELFGNSC